MNIYEQRRDIARLLQKELASSYVVVSGPDHPLLIEGPDALIGGAGGMLAIFMPKAKERASPDRLAVRFILSRLALPPDTRHVLVLQEGKHDRTVEELGRNFATVLDWTHRRDLAKIARDKEYVGEQRVLPREVAAFVQHRYADALQATRVLQWMNRSYDREKLDEQHRKPFRHRRKPEQTQFERVAPGVLFTSFGRGAPDSAAVRSLADQTTLAGFSLDNGVPYPTREDDYGLALVDRLPEYRGDPDKLIRAAAFAGWGFIPEEQQHRVQAIAYRLQERRKSRPSG